jgi:hypothetical protein
MDSIETFNLRIPSSGVLVNARKIINHSTLLKELFDDEDDIPTVLDVIVGSLDTVHIQTVNAVEALEIVPTLVKMIREFNNPVQTEIETDNVPITRDTMCMRHSQIKSLYERWKRLKTSNEVYDWLFPLSEYTIELTKDDDIFHKMNEFPSNYFIDTKKDFAWRMMHVFGNKNTHSIIKHTVPLTCTYVNPYEISKERYDTEEFVFHMSCIYGDLNICKWLLAINDKIDVHDHDDEAFYLACRYGHLDIAQWIYSFGDVNLYTNECSSFVDACRHNKLEVVKWLYSLNEVFVDALTHESFKLTISQNSFEVMKWIHSIIGTINIDQSDFINAVYWTHNIEFCKWLYEVCEHVEYIDVKDVFERYHTQTSLEMNTWLLTLIES